MSALDAFHERRRHLACHIGIFREIFKITSAERRALDVHSRSQQNADPLRLTFIPEILSHLCEKSAVKTGCRRAACRKADSLNRIIDAKVVPLLILLAQSVRAVGYHGLRDIQTLHPFCVPEVCP